MRRFSVKMTEMIIAVLVLFVVSILFFSFGYIYGRKKVWDFVIEKYQLFPKEIPSAAKAYAREMKYIDKRKNLVSIDGGRR